MRTRSTKVAALSLWAAVAAWPGPVQAEEQPLRAIARIEAGNFRIEYDARLHSRLVTETPAARTEIGPWLPAETVRVGDRLITDFAVEQNVQQSARTDAVRDGFGAGTRTFIAGRSGDLRKEVALTTYQDFPTLVVVDVAFINFGSGPVEITGWAIRRQLAAGPGGPGPTFWSYQPGSYERRPDWLVPLRVGFSQSNFLGMNATDYGGGTPVVDVWRRDVGLALGHLDRVPRLLSLPVAMRNAKAAELGLEEKLARTLRPREALRPPRSFVLVHRGDHFAALTNYRRLLERQGVSFTAPPASAYEPIWCGWGYERGVTVAQMTGTLATAASLGFKWAVLDDGWQRGVGDWQPDLKKFPGGEAEMRALTGQMRSAGLWPMLWWTPLAAHPKSELARAHPDYRLLGKDGKPNKISWWDADLLCPAYKPVREHTRALVEKFTRAWGYAGLKLDGQHLNAVPPCYNPAHNHRSPNESVVALPGLFQMIFETARAADPSAVVELCPCGTSYNIFSLPFTNLPAASDPSSSWQVRHKGKTFKALLGPSAPFFGDHVELSDNGDDFASTIGVGGVPGTQFTLPGLGQSKRKYQLTPAKAASFRQWLAYYRQHTLSRGEYLGELYDLGFDRPEAHAIRTNSTIHYAFFAPRFAGEVSLRGLGDRRYEVRDVVKGQSLGRVQGPIASVPARFERFVFIEATPVAPSASESGNKK